MYYLRPIPVFAWSIIKFCVVLCNYFRTSNDIMIEAIKGNANIVNANVIDDGHNINEGNDERVREKRRLQPIVTYFQT